MFNLPQLFAGAFRHVAPTTALIALHGGDCRHANQNGAAPRMVRQPMVSPAKLNNNRNDRIDVGPSRPWSATHSAEAM
jgi:hypothetical protein